MLESERDQQMALGRPKCLWFVWVFPSKVDTATTENMRDCTATATLGR